MFDTEKMIDILIPTVAQGLLWALLALGVYITFRVLDIADLSVEGSFPLGAAVAATALVNGYGMLIAFFFSRDSYHDWSLLHQSARNGKS